MSVSRDGSNTKRVPTLITLNISDDCFDMRHFFFDEAPLRDHFLIVRVRLGQCPLCFDNIEDRLDIVHTIRRPFEFDSSSTFAFDGGDIVRLRNPVYHRTRQTKAVTSSCRSLHNINRRLACSTRLITNKFSPCISMCQSSFVDAIRRHLYESINLPTQSFDEEHDVDDWQSSENETEKQHENVHELNKMITCRRHRTRLIPSGRTRSHQTSHRHNETSLEGELTSL
jgi:hypothetical protein